MRDARDSRRALIHFSNDKEYLLAGGALFLIKAGTSAAIKVPLQSWYIVHAHILSFMCTGSIPFIRGTLIRLCLTPMGRAGTVDEVVNNCARARLGLIHILIKGGYYDAFP
ncbi:hypothetical protein [Paenibacillus catalpae]|uniref:hypothetical protein n=1 Tax=Paenibacillus catalpae TaxID=1045775 RepID=UPI00111385A2|nr:hypothetical protein [Paenibacillus catalpae]